MTKFQPGAEFVFGGDTIKCSVASELLARFQASEVTCAQELDPSKMTREEILSKAAPSCCGTSESVCVKPFTSTTTTSDGTTKTTDASHAVATMGSFGCASIL